MELNYSIRFEKHGELIRKAGVPANEIWLDVGNALQMGCIDHHHAEGYESTLSAMTDHTEYLSKVRQCVEEGRPIIIHLHISPDLDCIASYYAFRYYLEYGEEAFLTHFSPDGEGWVLVSYINDIDAGRRKVTHIPTLYAVFCEMQETQERISDDTMLERGVRLILLALDLQKKTGGNLAEMDLTGHLPDEFEEVIDRITSSSFEEEKQSGKVHFETVAVWKHTGETMVAEDVCAAIWDSVPSYSNAYDHARKDGALLTVVPWKIRGVDDAAITKVMISVDPDKDPQKEYTLRPLAEIIEQMEQVEEESLYEQTGNYRRDHSEPRSGRGVFGEMPFAATADPWFIHPDESLIDAPRNHSLLDYQDILKVIRNNGSAVRNAYTVSISGDTIRPLYKGTRIPLSAWQEENRKILAREKAYVVVWAEVDASLIRKNTRMLVAYCMSLTGRPLSEKNEEKLYFPDYRTCVFSDLNCTIVLVATYDENNLKQLPIATLAALPAANGEESFRLSRLVDCIHKLLFQRHRLLTFGTRIGSIRPGRRKEPEELYSEILAFSADAQKDDMIGNAFERELYQFIKKQFGIDELKNSVMEEMKLVIDESRNKLVSGFNILTAVAAPFLLISAVFEMGIIRFDSWLDLSGSAARWGWIAIIAFGAFITFKLLRKK